ncbi:hypothetical protein B6U80_00510 [Candidatus Pacearchaeota archaeon ex4484_26]|nr:MAG: hypothetical protein B6U80_00510 [Candidatus Pacearchaeota archaeon ex4484_26]
MTIETIAKKTFDDGHTLRLTRVKKKTKVSFSLELENRHVINIFPEDYLEESKARDVYDSIQSKQEYKAKAEELGWRSPWL